MDHYREQNYGTIASTCKQKYTENNNKRPSKRLWVSLLVIGAIMAIIGAVLFPVGDVIIRDQIEKKVIISNTSETYDIWQDNPVPIYMQFYLFNVENEEEVLKGEKPVVSQHGPYTYRERRVKYDIVWNPNGTVSYLQNKTYHFIPEMSNGMETDMFTTVNPLMATVIQAIKWVPGWVRTIISLVIGASGADGLFMTRPVKEILWGYDDPTLEALNKIIPLWFFSTYIGYFTERNNTNDGLYTVFTGEGDVTKLGQINKYNGLSHVELWTSPWANMVNGTDGTVGAPFRFSDLVQSVFISDLCRSLNGNYQKIVSSPQGIPLRRFSGNNYTFANTTFNPDNIGFCTPQTNCLPSGLLNASLCQDLVDYFRVPAILSFPHYLYADPEVQKSVEGMSPNEKEHETTIDIEPWTGMVLQVASRLQINFFVEKVEAVSQTKNISSLYFPILWLNESAKTDKEHEDLLLDELFMPMTLLKVVKITLLTIGVLFCIVAVFVLSRQTRDRTKLLKGSGEIKSKENHERSQAYNSLGHNVTNAFSRSQSSGGSDHSHSSTPTPLAGSGADSHTNVPGANGRSLYPETNYLLRRDPQ